MVPETSESSAPIYALLHDSLTDEHELGVVRGALAAAREARATLLTLDRRAVPTYERMGVQYRLIA
jgi:hypothetical protein